MQSLWGACNLDASLSLKEVAHSPHGNPFLKGFVCNDLGDVCIPLTMWFSDVFVCNPLEVACFLHASRFSVEFEYNPYRPLFRGVLRTPFGSSMKLPGRSLS